MSSDIKYPLQFPAIAVRHPLGEFYLTSIPARVLLQVTYSDVYTRLDDRDVGHQRKIDPKRIRAIGRYIETRDAVFPGTIILAANTRREIGLIDPHDPSSWHIELDSGVDSAMCKIVVPTGEKLVAVVDGQHRLHGFEAVEEDLRDMHLPCAVFMGLPTPQQAAVFATINYNQKQVNKSLTYELFGCSVDDEAQEYWPPEKLAVFFARRLSVDELSPFRNHIKVAAVDGRMITESNKVIEGEWLVSTATIVEGILSLITKNAILDRDIMLNRRFGSYKRIQLAKHDADTEQPPLRSLYVDGDKDRFIYKVLLNYFKAVEVSFWNRSTALVMRKTAGVQALFLLLKALIGEFIDEGDVTFEAWQKLLETASRYDFSDAFFLESSARGRSRILTALLILVGRMKHCAVKDEKFRNYLEKTIPIDGVENA